jgi:uncharacterized protein (TIGR03083 family)
LADEYRALIADLEAEHADLDDLVAPLSKAEWSTPTPADGWTVSDSILHLALTDEVAALAASDPVGFKTYRAQRRGGNEPFENRRNLPNDQLLDLWRANRTACWRRYAPPIRVRASRGSVRR